MGAAGTGSREPPAERVSSRRSAEHVVLDAKVCTSKDICGEVPLRRWLRSNVYALCIRSSTCAGLLYNRVGELLRGHTQELCKVRACSSMVDNTIHWSATRRLFGEPSCRTICCEHTVPLTRSTAMLPGCCTLCWSIWYGVLSCGGLTMGERFVES